jgi:anti-sigma-K factor RskA
MSPAERDRLAAEYALGVLEGSERERADALFLGDAAFTRAVTGWTAHLGALDRSTPDVAPDPALWARIRAGLTNPAAPVPAPQPRPAVAGAGGWRRIWANLGFWRPAGLVAGFAALLLAVGLGVAVQRASRAPVLVAVLLTDASRPAAVVNAFADGRIELIPLDTIPVPPGKALEIWTLWDRARGPVSVGLIDAARRVNLRLEGLPTPGPNQLFEITLEPATGSPTGRPTGPILMKGTTSTTL